MTAVTTGPEVNAVKFVSRCLCREHLLTYFFKKWAIPCLFLTNIAIFTINKCDKMSI